MLIDQNRGYLVLLPCVQVKHDQHTDEEGLEQLRMKKNEMTTRQEQLKEQRSQHEQRIEKLEGDVRLEREREKEPVLLFSMYTIMILHLKDELMKLIHPHCTYMGLWGNGKST